MHPMHGTAYSLISYKISVYHNAVEDTQGYGEVTIVVTPPTGPYLIDNTIHLSCFVNPWTMVNLTPPDSVTYRWRILTLSGTRETSGQNMTYTPSYYRDFHYLWLYCQVFSNGIQIIEGKKVIEVHGRLESSLSCCELSPYPH